MGIFLPDASGLVYFFDKLYYEAKMNVVSDASSPQARATLVG
jgi:hypothetical protein